MEAAPDSLSRRLGPVFAEIAAQARKPSTEEHKAECRARQLDELLQGGPVFAEMAAQAANAQQGPKSGQQGVENPNPMPAPSKAYKPAHGGYPG